MKMMNTMLSLLSALRCLLTSLHAYLVADFVHSRPPGRKMVIFNISKCQLLYPEHLTLWLWNVFQNKEKDSNPGRTVIFALGCGFKGLTRWDRRLNYLPLLFCQKGKEWIPNIFRLSIKWFLLVLSFCRLNRPVILLYFCQFFNVLSHI